ncbi:kinase-like protein [Athelia psychrophila]|uniref:Kinase-like protein n=1 Tax=Athelia psychrophila TaxID=1759441 RepID=A0A166K681_9AGAM|nr:kinase-like protein [Fibularhizoctonia sp. CBS 109695]
MLALARTVPRIPPDLTGQIVYQTTQGIEGGHGHIGRGTWTDCKGCKYPVAVKIIMIRNNDTGKVTSADCRKLYKRARRERNIWERLEHENIVPLRGITTDCPFPFAGPNPIAMISPWMEGGNLFQALEAQPFTEALIRLRLRGLTGRSKYKLGGVARGLEHLHALEIIQGDLYPANVLIDSKGNACLTDFGLSFMVPAFLDTSYWSRNIGGAMRWRAPELLPPTSPEEIENYAMSGKKPYFNIECDSSVILYLSHRIQPTRPPQLADSYWNIITRCWGEREKPSSRPNAQELVNAISDLQGSS